MWWPGPVLLDGQDITDVPTDFSQRLWASSKSSSRSVRLECMGIVTEEVMQLPAEERVGRNLLCRS